MLEGYEQAEEQLIKTLESRKILEKEWENKEEKILEATHLGFPNINNLNLLDYAILRQDENKVSSLLEEGIKSEKAIYHAILVKNKAILSLLIKKELPFELRDLISFLEEKQIELRDFLIKIKINSFLSDKQNASDNQKTLWHYIAFIKPIEITNEIKKNLCMDDIDTLDNTKRSPLYYSIMIANNKMAKYLVHEGASINKSVGPNTAIQWALNQGNHDLFINFSQKVNPLDKVNALGENVLISAIQGGNPDLVLTILASATVYPREKDYLGRNYMHHAALMNNDKITKLLMQTSKKESYLNEKDFSGCTPLDLAMERGNQSFINQCYNENVSLEPKNFIAKEINQANIIKNMRYALRMFNHDPKIIKSGLCNALAFIFLIHAEEDKIDEFFKKLSAIANWDGTIETAQKSIESDFPEYTDLLSLLLQFANDAIWFQNSIIDSELKKIAPYQKSRAEQYNLVKPKNKNFSLEKYFDNEGELKETLFSITQLEEMLHICAQLPKAKVEISGACHATALYVKGPNEIFFYDPNQPVKILPFENVKDLARFIWDIKYEMLKIGQKSEKPITFTLYKNKKYHDRQFRYFTNETLPNTPEEMENFQKRSPNYFTPFHIAVLIDSVQDIEFMSKNESLIEYLNKQDRHNYTALEYIEKYNKKDAFIASHKYFPDTLAFSYNISCMFKEAIKNDDLHFLNTLDISKISNTNLEKALKEKAELMQLVLKKPVTFEEKKDQNFIKKMQNN